jgi:excisionase family DNA binding protein
MCIAALDCCGMKMKEQMMTVREVANELGKSEQTVRTWLKRGRFPGAKLEETPLGPYWLIPSSAVESFSLRKAGRPPKTSNKGKSK